MTDSEHDPIGIAYLGDLEPDQVDHFVYQQVGDNGQDWSAKPCRCGRGADHDG